MRVAIKLSVVLMAAVAGAATSHVALAADAYPSKPITMLVGFAPGGGTDVVARLLGKQMAAQMHASIIVENKAGAGGGIASQVLSHSPPDGYTIMLASIGSLSVNQFLGVPLGYDPAKFSFISLAVAFPNVVVVNKQTGLNSLKDLDAAVRAPGSKLSYGSSGVGSAGHLAGELYKERLGIKGFSHIPYRGGAPAMSDLLGNNVPVLFAAIGDVLPQVQGGKLTVLAVTGSERAPLLPNVPTLDEEGLKGFNMTNWYGFIAPYGTPQPIVNKLHTAVVQALGDKEVKAFLAKSGMTPTPSTPKQMADYAAREAVKWGKLIKDANIKQ